MIRLPLVAWLIRVPMPPRPLSGRPPVPNILNEVEGFRH